MNLKDKIAQIKKECEIKALQEFGTLFLLETGFEVGQELMCKFFITNHIGMQRFSLKEGIIKKDGNGCVFVESKNELENFYSKSNGRIGRNERTFYQCKKEKVIASILDIPL